MNLYNEKAAKKTYQSPTLVVYGDIRNLTQNSAVPDQNLDNYQGNTPNKTGFNM